MKRLLRRFLFAGAVCCALTLTGAHAQRGGRIGTPPDLKCPRDNTTAFTGRVLAYSRGRGRIFIRVRTDEQTTEQFTLRYGAGDFKTLFRLRGELLAKGDLAKIEVRPGKLRRDMRATVWACYKGDEPVAERIDWRPPEE